MPPLVVNTSFCPMAMISEIRRPVYRPVAKSAWSRSFFSTLRTVWISLELRTLALPGM